MQKTIPVLAAILLCVAVLAAGCTSQTGAAGAATPTPAQTTAVASTSLASLVLTPADLPAGSTLVSSQARSAADMSSMAKDLGWQEGYVTVCTLPGNATAGTTTVTQSLAVYAGRNISDIVALVESNDRQQNGLSFADLLLPATEPDTRAYVATPVNATATATSSGGVGTLSQDKKPAGEGYEEAIFGKGTVLEVIRITGPGADAATLASIAEVAYKKLG